MAPVGYNEATPQPGLPSSPLAPEPAGTGFCWGALHPGHTYSLYVSFVARLISGGL